MSDLLTAIVVQPLSDHLDGLLGLIRGGDFTGVQGPDWLVGDDHFSPFGFVKLFFNTGELGKNNFAALFCFSLLEIFSDAVNKS